LTITTPLLGAMAFSDTGKVLSGNAALATLLMASTGLAVCWVWDRTIKFYGQLFGAKFEILRELEADLYFDYKCYTREGVIMKRRIKGGWLTKNERIVPWIFAFLFFSLLVLPALAKFECIKSCLS
jgi:hypothetical protein